MPDKFQLDLPEHILPEVPDGENICAGRLLGVLRGEDGLEEAHVIGGRGRRR